MKILLALALRRHRRGDSAAATGTDAMRFRSHAVTHPGMRRDFNEDVYIACPERGLWAVADGAGGHQSGDVASAMVAEALQTIPGALTAQEALIHVRLRISAAHTALQEAAARKGQGAIIASTVVVLLVRDSHFACLWAGDSRAYLLRDGSLVRITRDHSLVQEMVDAGDLSEEQAEAHPQANVVTRAVGDPTDSVVLDKVIGRLAPGDRFLLCSDGLSKALDDALLAELLAVGTPQSAADDLLATALGRDARDNVTAVVVEVVSDEVPAEGEVA
jgi:serine/threonine protein phosphatase Stp1